MNDNGKGDLLDLANGGRAHPFPPPLYYTERRHSVVTYSQQLEESVQCIKDRCIFKEGSCNVCECKAFCTSTTPMDYKPYPRTNREMVTDKLHPGAIMS